MPLSRLPRHSDHGQPMTKLAPVPQVRDLTLVLCAACNQERQPYQSPYHLSFVFTALRAQEARWPSACQGAGRASQSLAIATSIMERGSSLLAPALSSSTKSRISPLPSRRRLLLPTAWLTGFGAAGTRRTGIGQPTEVVTTADPTISTSTEAVKWKMQFIPVRRLGRFPDRC